MAKNNIVAEVKASVAKKQKEEKTMQNQNRNENIKNAAAKAYKWTLRTICEVVEAAFAMVGIISVVHTDVRLQTGIAIFVVLLILVVRTNNKK
jgi:F0F1-type ATP synthase assembly protein I